MSGPVLRYPGAKWTLAEWILGHFPAHDTYFEPFFGSGAMLFCKDRSPLEIINDLDQDVVNLFQVMREHPEEMIRLVNLTPFAEVEYERAFAAWRNGTETDSLRRALDFLIITWMSRGVRTSQQNGKSGFRRVKDPQRNPSREWHQNLPERIMATVQRLQGVQVESSNALELIPRYARPNILIYADPPYVRSTRDAYLYRHEMSLEEHAQLLTLLEAHPGPVVLSGYDSELYTDNLPHWHTVKTNAVAQTGNVKVEILWLNPVAWSRLKQAQPALLEVTR